ncbi:hypothetical protein Tco_1424533, partial [Tanacetum coccineum]
QEKLRYDSDIKAVNILLLGLPVDIYTLINHFQTAKEIWDRVKELMEGTEMTKYAKLINDMHMIPMSMSPMQINTKFVNHLQLEWSSTPITQQLIQSPPLQSYAPQVVQQPLTFQPDTGLAIPTLLPTDDPIASLNKAMIFLSLVYHSKFPPINNQLRTSSNPRTQATIQNGQVMVQNVQGEGHMAKQCTAKKRVKDSEWFKDKMLLAQAQEAGVLQTIANFKAGYVYAYDSDCDDEATTNAIFMANLSLVGSLNDDTITPHYDSDTLSELKGNSDVISYADYMLTIGDDAEHNHVYTCDSEETLILAEESRLKMLERQTVFNTKPIYYSKLNKLYEIFVPRTQLSAEQLYWSSIPIPPVTVSKPTVFPKKLPSTSEVLRNLNKARDLLTKFDECIKRRTTLSPHEIGSWEQSNIKVAFKEDVIPFSENLKETFKFFEKRLY